MGLKEPGKSRPGLCSGKPGERQIKARLFTARGRPPAPAPLPSPLSPALRKAEAGLWGRRKPSLGPFHPLTTHRRFTQQSQHICLTTSTLGLCLHIKFQSFPKNLETLKSYFQCKLLQHLKTNKTINRLVAVAAGLEDLWATVLETLTQKAKGDSKTTEWDDTCPMALLGSIRKGSARGLKPTEGCPECPQGAFLPTAADLELHVKGRGHDKHTPYFCASWCHVKHFFKGLCQFLLLMCYWCFMGIYFYFYISDMYVYYAR